MLQMIELTTAKLLEYKKRDAKKCSRNEKQGNVADVGLTLDLGKERDVLDKRLC